jgi:putative transposase
VTPADRHAERDVAILAHRRELYATARKRNPRRWSGPTRDWTPIGPVYLNPAKATDRVEPLAVPIS